ncbi:MAG: CBS domain-containing protein [Desulfurococcales archaeon]|nr:CBS domain-containing protein [Desulfurococcales archaeon]
MTEEYVDEVTCGEVMRSPVVTASEDETVDVVARKMRDEGVGSVIIVDENMILLGVVTKTDIVYKVVAEGKNPSSVLVRSIMVRDPYYVYKDTPLREAAELMGIYGIGHLPVLDRETNKVVGVISKTDIIRLAPDYIMAAYAYLKKES